MSSLNLTNIEEKFKIPHLLVLRIENFIMSLRFNDTISSSLFARKTGLSLELGKKVLGELVSLEIMEYFIIVPCSNPIEDAEHYTVFTSLADLNTLDIKENQCPLCGECGYKFDIRKAKVGYKRSIKGAM